MTTPLANNPQPTSQEVFDAVAHHAAQMTERSHRPGFGCVYRHPDGNKCFVGALLTDREAEGCDRICNPPNVTMLVDEGRLPARLVPHQALLSQLQQVHDLQEVQEWPNGLREVAQDFGLIFTTTTGA